MQAGGVSGHMTMLRIDPKAYAVRVKYDVANAGSLREWFDALKPLAVINGGYYDEQGKATALVIFDGIRSGESYQGFGGMVAINEQGGFELRSLSQQAFDPNENLQQAMQSSPMLIQPGGVVSELEPDLDRSRRTVIARDVAGRILLIVSDSASFTLLELAQALKNSDLELDAALNLDGGRSTGMYVRTDTASVQIDSFDKLPLVLVVQRQ
jgi:exopolysaccharide biosynthesis protein